MKIWLFIATSLMMKKWYEVERQRAWHELRIRRDDLPRENRQIKRWVNQHGVIVKTD